MDRMKKIDIHLHLSYRHIPKIGAMYFSSGKDMLPHLDELSIGMGVLMSGGENFVHIGSNRAVRAICRQFPDRYRWMCNVDCEHSETLEKRLALYKEQGAVGIGEIMIHKHLDDPFMERLFTAAERLNMPVLMHMSPSEGMGYGVIDDPGLPLLEKTLRNHPKLIVIGHSQPFWHEITKDPPQDKESRNKWGEGPVVPGGRVVELLDCYPNLMCDLSANSGGHALMRDTGFGVAFAEKYQDRLMFGTDMFNKEMIFPLGEWLDKQHSAQLLSDSAYRKICHDNAVRILNLS